jgi:methylenetetrahydrofolate reductase (NADPH)
MSFIDPSTGPANSWKELEISFEFFPPRGEQMEHRLQQTAEKLAALKPDFVSVTYGAGGSTRDKTLETALQIQNGAGVPTAAHLTCVGASRGEVDDIARHYWSEGIRHIVALRGDPESGAADYRPHADGYGFASDLVSGLRRIADFEISVAAYPETHPEARSAVADLDNLRRKIDAGADRAITQFFFDPDTFLRFRDRAAAHGVSAPIVAGILPVRNFDRTVEFAQRCGTRIPQWMSALFRELEREPLTRELVAAEIAAEHCRYLQSEGVSQFHFYTLNRAELSTAICHLLRAPAPGNTAPRHARPSVITAQTA